jgi:CRP/FNR family cyclic AMP-dependent transcriptional regulator
MQVVGEEGPGGFFGEMGLIDDTPRASTIVALESCDCALLAKWDFESEVRRDPEVGLELLRTLSARIRALDARLSQVARTDGRTA